MKDTHLVLKELRLKHNMTQAEVAKLSGLGLRTVLRLEQRADVTTLRNLELAAAALGYEVQIKFVRSPI